MAEACDAPESAEVPHPLADGVYWDAAAAVKYRVENGEATVLDDLSLGRSRSALDLPDRLGGVPVASVEPDAFADCADLRSVSLPDSLRSVGFRAFLGCANLTNVVVGAGLKVVEFDAFSRCPNLAAVRIAATNATIYANAFRTEDGKAPAVFEVGGVPSLPPAYKPDDEDEDWEDCDDPDSDDEDLGDGDEDGGEDWDEDEDFDDEDFDEDDDADDDEIDE